jgi:hypothetical protein
MYRALPDREAGHNTPFSFEHVWEMKEAEYLALTLPEMGPWSLRARLKLAGLMMLGPVMLLSPYSAGVGVLLMLLTATASYFPRVARWSMSKRFAEAEYLRGPVAYGVSRGGLWMRGAHVSAESDWDGLVAWREVGDWLVLSPSGMPPVYLPITALREQGLYEPIVFLARANGRASDAVSRERNPSDVPT